MMTKWHVPFVAATLFSLCTSTNTFAQSPFDPVKDAPKLPRVLLIGDSISIGYTVPVQQLLKGKANVHRIPVNGQYSAYGLENLKEWLGKDKWDVIHFNWGIWDTHLLDSNGEILSNEEEAIKPGKIRTTIAEYQKNLNKIIDILEPTGAKLIWATSTPITTRKGDHALSIAKYNKAAAKVMNLRRVAVDDLNGLITPHLSEMQDADGCHFSDQGYDYLGKQVAKHILAALNTGKGQSTLTWDAEQTGKEILEGRDVLRFEHDCLNEWGYSQKERQYFFVVEPKVKDNGPLMVCLHSAGGNGQSELPDNVKRIADAGADFTGLVLNSGPDSEWWWGANEIKANPDKYHDTLTPVENRVLATIEWVVQKYHIDRNRIYLRGISMGGSGTLGIGMSHGDIFAALLAGVPAGTPHAAYRLNNSKELKSRIGRANDVPPVFVFFSQKDQWSETMEPWLDLVHRSKLGVVAAWGPWGHENHYEMTNPAAYEFPWLSIRKGQAYPAFSNASSDEKYPGFQSDAADQNGQSNAYFRWNVLDDQADKFALELRLVQSGELSGSVTIPKEVTTDVTLRRLQHFGVSAGMSYRYSIDQAGHLVKFGHVVADDQALLTIPKLKVTAKPITVYISSQSSR